MSIIFPLEEEEAAKAGGINAGQAVAQAAPSSKHVRNDYIRAMKWSNPAVEFAAGGTAPLQAHATAVLPSDSSSSPSAITLDQAKYAQCVVPLPMHVTMCSCCS